MSTLAKSSLADTLSKWNCEYCRDCRIVIARVPEAIATPFRDQTELDHPVTNPRVFNLANFMGLRVELCPKCCHVPSPASDSDEAPPSDDFRILSGMRCSVCKRTVFTTTSGTVCAEGHGGCDEPGDPTS